MKNFFNFKILLTFIVAYLFTQYVYNVFPFYYTCGFLLLLLLVIIFFRKSLSFLFFLLLFRAVLDPFFIKIRFNFGGANLGLGGGISLLLIILTSLYIFSQRESLRRAAHLIVGLYLLFCLHSLFLFFNTPAKAEVFKVIVRYFSILSIMMLSIVLVKTEKDGRFLIKAMVYSALFTITVGFALRKFNADNRFEATLGHPNILAFYLLIIFGCLIFRLDQDCLTSSGLRFSRWRYVYFVLLLVAMLLTQTRSGWIAFILMIFLYVFLFKKKYIIPILLCLVILFALPIVKDRFSGIVGANSHGFYIKRENTFGWRLEKWGYILDESLKKPWTGHGLEAAKMFGKDKVEAHNDYLRFFAELGVLGVITYFLPFFYLLRFSIKNLKKFTPNSLITRISKFMVIFLPAFLVMSISENLAAYVIIQWYFWCIAGVYIALISIHSKQPRFLER